MLRITLPTGKRVYTSTFREEMAKRLGTAPVVFHRHADGRAMEGLPKVRFVGGKGWLGIVVDPGLESLLYEHMGAAVRAVTDLCRSPVQVQIHQIETACVLDGIPRTYWVSEMVLKRRHPAARAADIQTLVEARLLASLHRFDAHHGLGAVPADAEEARTRLQLDVLDVVRPRGLRLRTDAGNTGEYTTLADVRFRVAGQFRGLWAVGNLTARGYGAVWKCLLSEEQIIAQQRLSAERKVVA